MLIPANVYPDFASATHLEELTLRLARQVLAVQKNPAYNSGVTDVIGLETDEEAEIAKIVCEGWEASLVDGELKIKNYFPNHPFTAGTGDYPFNRIYLLDALFHAVVYQQLMELNLASNPGDGNQYLSFSAASPSTKGRSLNFDVSFSLTNIPLFVVYNGDTTVTKAKPYLQG